MLCGAVCFRRIDKCLRGGGKCAVFFKDDMQRQGKPRAHGQKMQGGDRRVDKAAQRQHMAHARFCHQRRVEDQVIGIVWLELKGLGYVLWCR